MSQKVIKEAKVGKNVTGGSGKVETQGRDYTHYFYNEIDKLWKEIMILQGENNKLRAQNGSVQ